MKLIYLTKGKATEVDDEFYDELNSYKWYASGIDYRPARRILHESRRLIMMYHQILRTPPWELSIKGLVVDHIDGNPLNNQANNLRIVSHLVNAQNTDRHRNRKGICYDKRHSKWKVYLDFPDKARINIGTYRTEDEALIALSAARKVHRCENN